MSVNDQAQSFIKHDYKRMNRLFRLAKHVCNDRPNAYHYGHLHAVVRAFELLAYEYSGSEYTMLLMNAVMATEGLCYRFQLNGEIVPFDWSQVSFTDVFTDIERLFIRRACMLGKSFQIDHATFYAAYQDWCACQNRTAMNARMLAHKMRFLGFQRGNEKGVAYWYGVKLG